MTGGRGPAAGVSRAALILAAAVIAAGLVLAGGALRSGPGPSPAPSPEASDLETLGTASLPPVSTPTPTTVTTPAPPEPTVGEVRGEFVGGLGHVDSCPILYGRDGVFELVLADGYRSRIRAGRVQLLDSTGAIVAAEGDLIGVNGKVGGGGSSCLVGSRLHVTKIVEVRHREVG